MERARRMMRAARPFVVAGSVAEIALISAVFLKAGTPVLLILTYAFGIATGGVLWLAAGARAPKATIE